MKAKLLRMPISILDDQRRSNLLKAMVQSMTIATVLGVGAVLLRGGSSPTERILIYLSFIVMMVGLAMVYALNRYGANQLASWLFLGLLIVALVVSDAPFEIVRGRTLFLLTIPIFAASILLPAYTSFVFAGVNSLVITIIGLKAGIGFNEFAVIGLFAIALLTWLSARSLEEALAELRQRNVALQASEQEKEILLKEIHHRVKNNLQIISSLLDLQSDFVSDETVKAVFQESRSRVRSMALIHEYLYQSPNLAQIDFAEYVQTLIHNMQRSYAQPIQIQTRLEPLLLLADTAVPLGLILSELVTNAYKHAFPQQTAGQIEVYLQRQELDIVLTVTDNGVGFPKRYEWRQADSLGLTIVQALVQQLQGTLRVEGEEGTSVTLTFPCKKL